MTASDDEESVWPNVCPQCTALLSGFLQASPSHGLATVLMGDDPFPVQIGLLDKDAPSCSHGPGSGAQPGAGPAASTRSAVIAEGDTKNTDTGTDSAALSSSPLLDVDRLIKELTLPEKVSLLRGKDAWSTQEIPRLSIPSITMTDGSHDAYGISFPDGPKGIHLPSPTAMGATFDTEMMRSVGKILASEAEEKGCQVLLAPTVCLQRRPLFGYGFEAFGEDPILSGTMASEYIRGVQENDVAVSVKYFAAHDQTPDSPEDNAIVSERMIRETSLLPFQIIVNKSKPWSFMNSTHRINGVHESEDHSLKIDILRKECGWDGLLMSDGLDMSSTVESLNAGLDLEMPGPSRWRYSLPSSALLPPKVTHATVDERVRHVLNLINKVAPALQQAKSHHTTREGNTPENRALCRDVARSSIVLLKNDKQVLPLDPAAKQTYALIGPGAVHPVINGGSSAGLLPYYVSKPYEAIKDVVGAENLQVSVGCYTHIFTPLLSENVTIPGSWGTEPGYALSWFGEDPEYKSETKMLHSTTTTQAQMFFGDGLPPNVPARYWLRADTTYTAPKTTVQLGLCVVGNGKLFVDGREVIDLWTSQPEKTLQTPMCNQASMEVTADLAVEEGKSYAVSILLKNESLEAISAAGLRVGCCEKIDPATALAEAVNLAKKVDVPIVIAGLNAEYDSEFTDRNDLELPPGINDMIEKLLEANPRTIVVNQSGGPVIMPWAERASTLVHAWFGGQETGNALADMLFGKHNPSGRMSVTLPRQLEKEPREMHSGEGMFLGYMHYEMLRNDPFFYFGYGLSYTTFEYSNLHVPSVVQVEGKSGPVFEVSVDVRNSGNRDGHEIVQVYISDIECKVLRPQKELKGFAKVWVRQGETVTARISLDKYALSYWDEAVGKWHAEEGSFKVIVSRSADPQDEVLERDFELAESFFWTGV